MTPEIMRHYLAAHAPELEGRRAARGAYDRIHFARVEAIRIPLTRFVKLNFVDPAPSHSAKRWDAAEAATYFNFNLAAMDASVDFVLQARPELVLEHNRKLIDLLFQRLPKGCVPASPLDSTARAPYGCFTARTPEETSELYQKLQKEHVVVAKREGRCARVRFIARIHR